MTSYQQTKHEALKSSQGSTAEKGLKKWLSGGRGVILAWVTFFLIPFLWALFRNNTDNPHTIPFVEFLLINGSLGFAIVLTYKRYFKRKEKVEGIKLDTITHGVFFGVAGNEPKGKPIEKDGHVLVVGGAGSGKSACVAIPTLRNFWDGRISSGGYQG